MTLFQSLSSYSLSGLLIGALAALGPAACSEVKDQNTDGLEHCKVGQDGATCSSHTDCSFDQSLECDPGNCQCIPTGSTTTVTTGQTTMGTAGTDGTTGTTGTTGPLTCEPETTEPNNLDTEAQTIPDVSPGAPICVTGTCDDMAGDSDWYVFTLTAGGTLRGEASACEMLTALTSVEFFDADLNFLDGPIDEMCDVVTEIPNATPGTYYMRVPCDPDSSGAYTVTVSVQP